jgi:hypothetical protein
VHTPFSDIGFIAVLLAGIAGVQLLVWTPIIVWFRRRRRAALGRLTAAIAAETVIRAPEQASYRGATASGFPRVNNNGVIALTSERLVFLTLTGTFIELPRNELTGIRQSKVFNRSVAGGHAHLIVQTRSGELGFFVRDNSAWVAALANRTCATR